jgi:uncharacterized membrane protein
MNWFLLWLFLHVLAAVIAFGPIFVFPVVGTLATQMPQHLSFAVELNHRIERRLVVPLALTMFVSGVGLIWTANINVFQTVYLLVAILLYFAALGIAFRILVPTTGRLVQLVAEESKTTPGVLSPEGTSLVRRNQIFGGLATLLFVAILALMIVQPGGVVFR